ncbi:MAG: glycosyltransferase family 4 protein [Ardenticatenaceae bacterium]|nr:glycosyltransferase family 4 protein [Ardenticatenaceae bacterium]
MADKKRILFVHDTHEHGGIELFMLLLIKYYDPDKYETMIMVPGYEDPFRSSPQIFIDMILEQGIPLLRPPDPTKQPGWTFWVDIQNMRRLFRENRIDLIHIHTPSPHRTLKPTLAAKLNGLPVIRSEHLPPTYWPVNTKRVQWGAKLIEWLSDRIVPGSKACFDEQIEILHRGKNKVTESCYGIELDRFDPQHDVKAGKISLGLDPDIPVVGKIARLSPEKGYQYLIDAIPHVVEGYGPVNFLIVGDGEEREELQARVEKLGIEEHVVFAGYVDNTIPYMQAMDISVMSSVNEGVSLAMLEFMAMGKPLVASAEPSFVETFEHGKEGILVPLRDPKGLADGILSLLRDPELACRVGQGGYKKVHDTFGIRRSARVQMDLYDELLP